MEKQPNKKSLKDFQNSELNAKQQRTAKGGWSYLTPMVSTFSSTFQAEQDRIMKMGMSSICCGNDNGVW